MFPGKYSLVFSSRQRCCRRGQRPAMPMEILYEDNHLLVALKPPNMPVQADASGDLDLLTSLKAYIKEKYHKPGDVYLGLVHRLDRPAGGVMVFARTSKAASRLSAQFAGHGARKKYFAILSGRAPGGELADYIRRLPEGGAELCEKGAEGAKAARLTYQPLAAQDGKTLADISLQTGRHHQIRLQFAGQGLPLWGDQRYNPAARPGEQLALWAYSLTVEHPTLHKPMAFTALPSGGAWDAPGFRPAMEAAAAGFGLVYADENILVLNKPTGLPTAAEDGPGDSLEGRARALYGEAYPLHRLDVNTTGLVLFARNPGAREAILEAFARRQVEKTYRCVVRGLPHPKSQDCRAYLTKDPEKARVSISRQPGPGAKEICTAYRVLAHHGEEESLLSIGLITGRTHQIRAHMAYMGHPLLGDDKYGDRAWNRQKRVSLPRLSAVELRFHLPPQSPYAYLNGLELRLDPPWTF